ncbi:MAG: trypsin-like peptidase domain-containing protein [Cellvibrionaceae bacterium]
MPIKNIISFSGWPIAIGLMFALAVLFLMPVDEKKQTSQTTIPEKISNSFSGDNLHPNNTNLSGPISYSQAVKRAAPAVVNIYTTKPRPRNPLLDDPIFRQYFNIAEPPEQQRILSSMGSGVIVSQEGYILTNHHVINGADEFFVFLNDGRKAQATPIGANTDNDLAVLKIDLENLTAIDIGMPEQAEVGDIVLAIGNPYGYGQSVSQGIISAKSRLGKTQLGLQRYIQTDAAINPGNSGGALVDVYGNLLGINTAILGNGSGESIGIGFAIPATTAVSVLNEIIEFSKTVHGYLGVIASPLTPRLARSLNLSFTDGLVITRIDDNSPAFRAQLLPGDVITRANNQFFEVDGSLIAAEISQAKPGDAVELEIWRNGKQGIVRVIMGASQSTPVPATEPPNELSTELSADPISTTKNQNATNEANMHSSSDSSRASRLKFHV